MTDAELGWLAAIIEGEGHVTMAVSNVRGGHFVPVVGVGNTDAAIMAQVCSLLDQMGVRYTLNTRATEFKGHIGKNPITEVAVHHFASIAELLRRVGPYFIGRKRGRAELLLRFVASRLPKIKKGSNAERAYSDEERALAAELRGR